MSFSAQVLRYSAEALLSISQSVQKKPSLATDVWTTVKQLGINKSPRWKRGGVSCRIKTQNFINRPVLSSQKPQTHMQNIPVITGRRILKQVSSLGKSDINQNCWSKHKQSCVSPLCYKRSEATSMPIKFTDSQ